MGFGKNIEFKDLTIDQKPWNWTDIQILNLSGDFAYKTRGHVVFDQAMQALGPDTRLIVNMAGVEQVEEVAASALVKACKQVANLKIAAAPSSLVKTLQNANLLGDPDTMDQALIRHYSTVEAAAEAFKTKPPAHKPEFFFVEPELERLFVITREQAGNIPVLSCHGGMTLGAGDDLVKDRVNAEILKAKSENRSPDLLLDMKGVPYIDSAGLGEIVRSHINVSRSGGQFVMTDLNKRIKDLLSITKLLTVFKSFDTKQEGMDCLNKLSEQTLHPHP